MPQFVFGNAITITSHILSTPTINATSLSRPNAIPNYLCATIQVPAVYSPNPAPAFSEGSVLFSKIKTDIPLITGVLTSHERNAPIFARGHKLRNWVQPVVFMNDADDETSQPIKFSLRDDRFTVTVSLNSDFHGNFALPAKRVEVKFTSNAFVLSPASGTLSVSSNQAIQITVSKKPGFPFTLGQEYGISVESVSVTPGFSGIFRFISQP